MCHLNPGTTNPFLIQSLIKEKKKEQDMVPWWHRAIFPILLTSCTEKHFVTLAPSHQDNNRLHFFHLRTACLKQQTAKQGEWGLVSHRGCWLMGFPGLLSAVPDGRWRECSYNTLHQRPSLGAARPTHSQPMSSAWRGARESPGGERKGGEGLRMLVLPAAPGMETGSARGMKTPALTPQQWTTWFALIIRCRITTNLRENSEKTSTETSHVTQEKTEQGGREGEFMFLKTSNEQEMILCLWKLLKYVLISLLCR